MENVALVSSRAESFYEKGVNEKKNKLVKDVVEFFLPNRAVYI